MTSQYVKVRHKGQITLPANLRRELGIDEGDDLIVQVRGQEIILSTPEDVVMRTAGIFKEYAYTNNPDPAEERRWVAQHIAETADCYDE